MCVNCLPDRIARPDTTLLADTQRIIDQANSDIRAAPPPGPRGPLRKRRQGHAAAPQREAAGPHLGDGAGKHRQAPPRAAATTKHPPRRGLLTAQHPSAALLSQSGQPTRLRPTGSPAYAPLLSAAANTIATELAPGQIMHQEPGLAKPDSQRDPRIDFLDPSRPEASDMQRIQAHGATNPSTTDKYERYWNVFRHYCEANSWDPYVFSIELATLFAAFMSKRVNQKTAAPIASIDCYFSALNRYYLIRHDTQPWSHGRMAELKTAFKRAQTQKAGEMHLPNAGLRIAVPPAIVQNILDDASTARGQAMSPRSSRLDHSDSDLRLAWYAVFLLQLLFLFRADTIAGVVDAANQITISAGRLTFEVRRLKRGGANISPFTRSIPIPTNSSHPHSHSPQAQDGTGAALARPRALGKHPFQGLRQNLHRNGDAPDQTLRHRMHPAIRHTAGVLHILTQLAESWGLSHSDLRRLPQAAAMGNVEIDNGPYPLHRRQILGRPDDDRIIRLDRPACRPSGYPGATPIHRQPVRRRRDRPARNQESKQIRPHQPCAAARPLEVGSQRAEV